MFPHRRLGGEVEQIGDAADMVIVPVRDQRGFNGDFFIGEGGGERADPVRVAFGGIDEDARGAGADEVGVGALEVELGEVSCGCVVRGGGVTRLGFPPRTRHTRGPSLVKGGSLGREANCASRNSLCADLAVVAIVRGSWERCRWRVRRRVMSLLSAG